MTRGQAPHVLVINVFFAPFTYGGATVVAEQVAQRLKAEHGFQVTAISATCQEHMPPYVVIKTEKAGIVNYVINLPFHRNYAESYDNPQVTEVVERLLRTISPDVVHMHCVQEVGAGIMPMIRRQGVPMVLSTHDFWWLCERQFMIRMDGRYCGQDPVRIENCRGCVDDFDRTRSRDSRLKAAAAMADVITYPSDFAHDLSARSGLTAKRSMVWRNGVKKPSPRFFEKQANRRAATGGRVAFGFVGGPSHIKGWPFIRKAFETIEREDFDGYLVDGSMDGSWWSDVDLKKLKGNWSVYPRFSQDEMDRFYAKIDVLLFMSQWKETFGLTIREALARGIKVIQTDSGGTTEHAAIEASELLQIGQGADHLLPHIVRVLEPDGAAQEPIDVTSFSDQATEMAACLRQVLQDNT
ncbi:glycosyltransferase [Shimia haliotis]|uniref:Glycosyltransferase involved in cell wall bisynthesis n=1 Tax=Shimia haliotis TaxID=1280847 RepID=A0A1I4EJY9_9RHOB|nr:glycosyltransferase [Shimia haliotis]SFL04776.1 Glycosyltransferase involved in cell wall bisynthesis [Shimia haliotis]